LPIRRFAFVDVADAFRYMAQARHIGKLVLVAPPAAGGAAHESTPVRASGTYLITGGTGALGRHTARWLVENGARTVVLTGRRAPDAAAQREIDDLATRGANVLVRAVDAGDANAMAALIREIDETLPPMRGVVHAAGVVDDGVLLHMTWPRWRSVLHGKARGARVLDQLTRHRALDFFVMYSAAGLYLGPKGQGPYAAANAELDALAAARRSAGLPALSVSWGMWPSTGMAALSASRGNDSWHERGLRWIDPVRAFAQLHALLRDDAVHAVAAPIDWPRFLAQLPDGADRSVFLHAAAAATQTTQVAARGRHGDATRTMSPVPAWRAAPMATWRGLLMEHVRERTRHILGVGNTVVLPEEVALKDLGLDSLMAVELRNALARSLATPLPATLLFDYPSLSSLCTYLQRVCELIPAAASGAPAVIGNSGAESIDEIAALSDDDAEALLLAELDAARDDAGAR
jgi:NAD(P)-dependent dehydrogenase (short-subunit alcohol dehydrogenase family)/acyl carrier protein